MSCNFRILDCTTAILTTLGHRIVWRSYSCVLLLALVNVWNSWRLPFWNIFPWRDVGPDQSIVRAPHLSSSLWLTKQVLALYRKVLHPAHIFFNWLRIILNTSACKCTSVSMYRSWYLTSFFILKCPRPTWHANNLRQKGGIHSDRCKMLVEGEPGFRQFFKAINLLIRVHSLAIKQESQAHIALDEEICVNYRWKDLWKVCPETQIETGRCPQSPFFPSENEKSFREWSWFSYVSFCWWHSWCGGHRSLWGCERIRGFFLFV